MPDQLRLRFPKTEFEFTLPGRPGQDVHYKSGRHPSEYRGSSWPRGVNYADFKPGTETGRLTFERDQKTKWKQQTEMLPYDPKTGKLR